MTIPSLEPSQSLPVASDALHQALAALIDNPETGPTGLILVRLDVMETPPANADPGGVGEQILSAVVARIGSALHQSDQVLRVGLDELAVVRSALTAPAETESLAFALRNALAEPVVVDGNPVSCPFNIGVAATLHGDSADDLIRFANHALANAVICGRNEMVAFDDTDRDLLASDGD